MEQGYQPIKPFDDKDIRPGWCVLMLPIDGPWHPEQPYKHFAPRRSCTAAISCSPRFPTTEAGAAFQSPRSGPGNHRLAGGIPREVSSSTSGSFRFVGFGDNVMIVQVGSHMVLDAS